MIKKKKNHRFLKTHVIEVFLVAVVEVSVQVRLVVEGLPAEAAGPLGRHVDLGLLLPREHIPGVVQGALQGQRHPVFLQHRHPSLEKGRRCISVLWEA